MTISEVFDEESRKAMIKELAIISGLVTDDANKIDNLNEYFKNQEFNNIKSELQNSSIKVLLTYYFKLHIQSNGLLINDLK